MTDDAFIQTIFSLSGDVPPAEPALGPDGVTGLRSGSLVTGSAREICFIRKFSGGGAMLHVDSPTVVGQRMELELMTGQQLSGTISWCRGSDVALRFDHPVDVFAIIASDLVSQPGERRRMPRVELRCAAAIESERGSDYVTTRDVSQGGVKIETASLFEPDEKVLITLDGFRAVEGHVRWRSGSYAGIIFDTELAWQDLMPWLKDKRDASLRTQTHLPRHPAANTAEPPNIGEGVELNLPARIREGTKRWNIEVAAITTRHVEFESFASPRIGTLLWLALPGLEGWPARVTEIDGYRFTCEFTQPLHTAVLERVLAQGFVRQG